MKCRKSTKSGQECSCVLLSGPKGLVCPCEMSHSDAQAFEVVISTTVHLSANRLNSLRSRLSTIWPKLDWSDDWRVVRYITESYIQSGEFSDIVEDPEIMVNIA